MNNETNKHRKHRLRFARESPYKTDRLWPLTTLHSASETPGQLWHARIRLARGAQLQLGLVRVGHVECRRHHLHSGVGLVTFALFPIMQISPKGHSPFLGDDDDDTMANIQEGEWEFCDEFNHVSNDCKDFISRLIVYQKG